MVKASFYSTAKNSPLKKLAEVIREADECCVADNCCATKVAYHQTFEEFSASLNTLCETTVLILSFQNENELNELLSIKHLIRPLDTLLILPEDVEGIKALAFDLYPRVVLSEGTPLEDLRTVISKMILREEHRNTGLYENKL
jgi:hypothetical protein